MESPLASIEYPVSSIARSPSGRGSRCGVAAAEEQVEMGVLAHIENVEMVWSLLVAYHGSLIQVILRECYNAIGAKAEFHISTGGVLLKRLSRIALPWTVTSRKLLKVT